MSTHFGQVEQFEIGKDDWQLYRLEQFFLTNGITDDRKKVAVFLTVIGAKAYNYALLRNILAPWKPAEKSYEDLLDALKII